MEGACVCDALRLNAPLWKSPLSHLAGHFASGLDSFAAEFKILGTKRDVVLGCPSNVFEKSRSNLETGGHRHERHIQIRP